MPSPSPTPAASPGWHLTFNDEFDSAVIDINKWSSGYSWTRKPPETDTYLADENLEVVSGTLRIRAEKKTVEDRHYTSGALNSYHKFAQRYGWFEVRVKIPKGTGFDSSFWLQPETKFDADPNSKWWFPEITIFEILGRLVQKVYMNNYYEHNNNAGYASQSDSWDGPDFSRGFHVFAIEWTSTEIKWFVDNVQRFSSKKGVPQEPMYLILSNLIGGKWPHDPNKNTPFPSYFEVDYVRVYQKH